MKNIAFAFAAIIAVVTAATSAHAMTLGSLLREYVEAPTEAGLAAWADPAVCRQPHCGPVAGN